MNSKEKVEPKKFIFEKNEQNKTRPKSLRPMHSIIAVRSLKPKTLVAGFMPAKPIEESKTN